MLEKFGNFYRLIKIIVIIITTLFKEGNTCNSNSTDEVP